MDELTNVGFAEPARFSHLDRGTAGIGAEETTAAEIAGGALPFIEKPGA